MKLLLRGWILTIVICITKLGQVSSLEIGAKVVASNPVIGFYKLIKIKLNVMAFNNTFSEDCLYVWP
jgi:hypothetical protein